MCEGWARSNLMDESGRMMRDEWLQRMRRTGHLWAASRPCGACANEFQ
jgi:hypothetical protein